MDEPVKLEDKRAEITQGELNDLKNRMSDLQRKVTQYESQHMLMQYESAMDGIHATLRASIKPKKKLKRISLWIDSLHFDD